MISNPSRKYLWSSIILLVSFIILAEMVSPKVGPTVGGTFSSVTQYDASAFVQINNEHYKPLNQLMILFSQYGREVVWTIAGIMLFIFGGWTGKKAAIVMAFAMLVLIPIGTIAKEAVGRSRPVI